VPQTSKIIPTISSLAGKQLLLVVTGSNMFLILHLEPSKSMSAMSLYFASPSDKELLPPHWPLVQLLPCLCILHHQVIKKFFLHTGPWTSCYHVKTGRKQSCQAWIPDRKGLISHFQWFWAQVPWYHIVHGSWLKVHENRPWNKPQPTHLARIPLLRPHKINWHVCLEQTSTNPPCKNSTSRSRKPLLQVLLVVLMLNQQKANAVISI